MVYGKKTGARAQYTLDIDHTDRFAPSTMRRGTIIAANGKCWLERILNARYGLGSVANWHQVVKEMGGEGQVRNRRKKRNRRKYSCQLQVIFRLLRPFTSVPYFLFALHVDKGGQGRYKPALECDRPCGIQTRRPIARRSAQRSRTIRRDCGLIVRVVGRAL